LTAAGILLMRVLMPLVNANMKNDNKMVLLANALMMLLPSPGLQPPREQYEVYNMSMPPLMTACPWQWQANPTLEHCCQLLLTTREQRLPLPVFKMTTFTLTPQTCWTQPHNHLIAMLT
jgi:hypothetical protein